MASNLKTIMFLALVCATLNISTAGDADILTDFIVPANLQGPLDGNFFTFTAMRSLVGKPFPITFKVSKASMAEFPALNGQSISYGVLQFPTGTVNPPHTHPRASELLFVLSSSLEVGLEDHQKDDFQKTPNTQSDGPMSHGKVCVLTESLHRVMESFIVSYRNRTYRIIATEFAYWTPNIESMEVNSESNHLERKDAEGLSLDESLENEEHLDVDSCDSDSPKNVNNDSVSPSSRVLREEDVRGVESDLVDSFEEGEIRDDSVLYNDGCIKDCMEKNLEDDAGEILGVHSQGDCGNVTTDDNEDVTPVIAPEKDSIIAPPSTPPGNDLNIAAESGSSWIDYIGPLTSDEIDSDKRWSYRDPNGNIHGLFSLAQLRSWKDYFPSDLQIWSYYGNVKEAILLHNALSRQTKDAG
ncbi:5-oxoprolinase-like protein [Tanacetum coccineum]